MPPNSNVFSDGFGSYGDFRDDFNGVDDECRAWIFDRLDEENQNLWRGVLVRNEEEKKKRNKENVEGLVCKSKGFLPMKLSNPEGVSFGAEEGNSFSLDMMKSDV